MSESRSERTDLKTRWLHIWHSTQLGLIFAIGLIGVIAILAVPVYTRQTDVLLELNDVSNQDILAPYTLSFNSELMTQQAREDASQAVESIYDPPDSKVARQQLEILRASLAFISSIRSDAFSDRDQKLADLSETQHFQINTETGEYLLDLSEARWQVVQLEAVAVLEQVMRSEIRDYQLEEARRSIPALVNISLPDDEAEIVILLVNGTIAPNAMYNEEATQQVRDQARESITPMVKTYAKGETIIGRGRLVTALHLEALDAYGLLEKEDRWQMIALQSLLAVVLSSLLMLYFMRTQNPKIRTPKVALATSILFILTVGGLQIMIPDHAILPYLFPAATLPMLLAIIVGPGAGILASAITAAIAGYLSTRGFEVTLYILVSGVMGSLIIKEAERLSSFFWSGAAASLAAAAIIVLFRFPDPATDLMGKASLIAAAVASGLLSASLCFGILLLLGQLVGITTNLQLIELARPDHPMLQLLLRNAPGSYQHSLQVANLAEQAARTIGANAQLTRVGALHHDVGKALQPQYFIENQIPGQNIHDQLDPVTSASIIIQHVTDGLSLARKHRLPHRVQAFISEHHGTMQTMYQYREALRSVDGNAEKLNIQDFTYPGPAPRSRETGILMLADSVEAKARAEKPENTQAIDDLVRSIIQDRLNQHQLDDTSLTLHDLKLIRQSFVSTLKGMYHPRIHYPEAPAARSDFPSDAQTIDRGTPHELPDTSQN
ncbi:MAG: HDIG domain-containing protein [Anaerolineales bacterium]|nr:HDIG domain-containing protein [Anaerolineales bacterium]